MLTAAEFLRFTIRETYTLFPIRIRNMETKHQFESSLGFKDVFYSIENNKIVEWKVIGVKFCDYNMDKYGNKCPSYTNIYDVEYVINRFDKKNNKILEETVDRLSFNKKFFTSKEKLFKSMEE